MRAKTTVACTRAVQATGRIKRAPTLILKNFGLPTPARKYGLIFFLRFTALPP